MAKVTRSDVSSVVLPDEVSETLVRGAVEGSYVAQLANTFPQGAQRKTLTEAEVGDANVFWVGEGQRKSTNAPSMTGKTWTLDAAELAVIIPIDENVYDDANVDLFSLYQDAIETAFARKIDKATLFGGADWPTDWNAPTGPTDGSIREIVLTAGGVFAEDASPTTAERLDLITGTNPDTPDGALTFLEVNGYDPNAGLARVGYRAVLRAMKDADGRYIFGDATSTGVPPEVFGIPLSFVPSKGARMDATKADIIFGDWSQAYMGTLQGIRYKVFDQGVITDGSGGVVYSLMENDMVALRMTARVSFLVVADDTADGETVDSNSEIPFAIVGPNGSDV